MSLTILAIDTSTDACTVSIACGDQIKSIQHIEPKKHTQILLPMINTVLGETHLSLKDCDVLAVGRGPGSFTGIRIACSVIQSFSFAMNKPIIAISTLRTIAQAAYRLNQSTQVLALLDARMQEYYAGYFKVDEEGVMQHQGVEFIQKQCEKDPSKNAHLSNVNHSYEEPVCNVTKEWRQAIALPDAMDMIGIAQQEFKKGNILSADQLEPVYMREEIVRNINNSI